MACTLYHTIRQLLLTRRDATPSLLHKLESIASLTSHDRGVSIFLVCIAIMEKREGGEERPDVIRGRAGEPDCSAYTTTQSASASSIDGARSFCYPHISRCGISWG